MAGFAVVTAFSVVMFFGSVMFGSVPLFFSLSEQRLRVMSAFGAGLLVGTALSVVIPEGLETLYFSSLKDQLRRAETVKAKLMKADVVVPDILRTNTTVESVDELRAVPPAELESRRAKRSGEHHHLVELDEVRTFDCDDLKNEQNPSCLIRHHVSVALDVISNSSGIVGFSLIFGFVFMLVVDRFIRGRFHGSGVLSIDDGQIVHKLNSVTAVFGLVVHSAADGIALGAACSSKMEVSLIVFLAIMLHKGPAAFGLVSYLLHESMERSRIRRYLLVFSLSAPVFALLTFGFLFHAAVSKTGFDATGVLLLMSAGTFLFVATVHILPEIASSGCGSGRTGQSLLNPKDLFALICGTSFPLIFSMGHSH